MYLGLGLPRSRRRWVFCLIVRPHESSLGCPRRRCVLRVVVGPYMLLAGLSRCSSALSVVVGAFAWCLGPYASRFGPPSGRWALCVVVGPSTSLLGRTRRCWTVLPYHGAFTSSFSPTAHRCVIGVEWALGCPTVCFPSLSCGSNLGIVVRLVESGIGGVTGKERRANTGHDFRRGPF